MNLMLKVIAIKEVESSTNLAISMTKDYFYKNNKMKSWRTWKKCNLVFKEILDRELNDNASKEEEEVAS